MCMIAGNIDGRMAEENEQVDHVKKSFLFSRSKICE